jgi:hypothetical protein
MSLVNMSNDKNISQHTSPEIRQRQPDGHSEERDHGRSEREPYSAMPHQLTGVSKNRKMRSFRADPW